ncbi:MAG: MauE/DoxX family redox-associated membrane protein [candidate division Zixibacteria bacterium]
MIKGILQNPSVVLISRIILGALFVYAAIDKIIHPLAFAQLIHHYRITPPELINYIAIAMPWIEFFTGVLLIIGYKAKGSNLLIGAMLIFFIVLLTVTATRGINVSCGCFSTSTAVKSNLVIRIIEDIGMLLLSLHIFLFYKKKPKP